MPAYAPGGDGVACVYVVKQGKLTTPGIQIPGLGGSSRKFVEVRPGLVWLATRLGIFELEEAEVGSGRYALREAFRPALDLWAPESMSILSDGRVAIRGVQDRLSNTWRLYALAAPER